MNQLANDTAGTAGAPPVSATALAWSLVWRPICPSVQAVAALRWSSLSSARAATSGGRPRSVGRSGKNEHMSYLGDSLGLQGSAVATPQALAPQIRAVR
jgi:hypothetical protein